MLFFSNNSLLKSELKESDGYGHYCNLLHNHTMDNFSFRSEHMQTKQIARISCCNNSIPLQIVTLNKTNSAEIGALLAILMHLHFNHKPRDILPTNDTHQNQHNMK